MLVHIALALQLKADPSLQPRLEGVPVASNAITDAAGYAVLNFLTSWRTAWLGSVDWRGSSSTDSRLRDDHCHWDGSYSAGGGRGYWRPPTLIHRGSRRSMCPDWFPADEQTPGDERVLRDASLTPEWRDRVHSSRAALLDSLATLAKLKPGDAWITGERVRFLVDQGQLKEALEVAQSCTADRVWCDAAHRLRATTPPAITLAPTPPIDAASAAMTPERRCKWNSVQLLLDDDGQSAYDHMSCDDRTKANQQFWWLHDAALLRLDADDRRSEDFARKVLIQLHSALPWDERFDWRDRFGGEARLRDAHALRLAGVLGVRRRAGGSEPRRLDGILRQHAHGDRGIPDGSSAPRAGVESDGRPVPRGSRRVADQHAGSDRRRGAGEAMVARRALRERRAAGSFSFPTRR